MKTVNIFGCCICRDIFRVIPCDDKYRVLKFVQFVNPVSTFDFQKHRIDIEDLEGFDWTNFVKRNFVFNINGDAGNYIASEKSDYLILDLADMRFQIDRYNFEDGTSKYIPSTKYSKQFEENTQLMRKVKIVSIEKDIKLSEEEINQLLDKYIKFIQDNYRDDQVILIENYEVDRHIDDLSKCFIEFNSSVLYRVNVRLKKAYDYLKSKKPKIAVIQMPEHCFGDARHLWGVDPLHFPEIYYQYLYKAFEIIVENSGNPTDELKTLKENYSKIFQESFKQKQEEYYSLGRQLKNVIKNSNFSQFENEKPAEWQVSCSKNSKFDYLTKTLICESELGVGNIEEKPCWAILKQPVSIDILRGKFFNLAIKYRTVGNSVLNFSLRYKIITAKGEEISYKYFKTMTSGDEEKVEKIVDLFPIDIKNMKDTEICIYLNKPNSQAKIFEVSLTLLLGEAFSELN